MGVRLAIRTGSARRSLARRVVSGDVLDVGCGDFTKTYRYLYGTNDRLRFLGLERYDDATIYGQSPIVKHAAATGAFERRACNIESEPFPLADSSVAGIFCSHTIEHVDCKEHLLAEMNRVLKPGAYAYIETPGPHSQWMPAGSRLQRIADAAGYPLNFEDDASHVGRPLSLEELVTLAEDQRWFVEDAGYNRELGILGLPMYAAMFALGLLPMVPHRVRGFLIGAGWWNLVGWPIYVLARKPVSP